MPKNLVIVESPAKAKTIEKFLGPDFKVESSFGHIRDLDNVDRENMFSPSYVVSKDKKDVVNKLKKLAKDSEIVWLASDEDREGEAIAWHLAETLKLDPLKTNRIVFHEITKKAITKAIEEPRKINMEIVNAQQARRVMDRIVGFDLSPVLWKKVRAGLSAGRVQSVAVRLIVEREREILSFQSSSDFRINASFSNSKGESFSTELNKSAPKEESVEPMLKTLNENMFKVSNLEKKSATRKPSAPFTTSTLQQEASRKLGYQVNRTMSLAQGLYESGLITYMRTDSLNLSQDAIDETSSVITENYGQQYVQARKYSTKAKGAQEAHEAIRPTNMSKSAGGNDDQQKKLYDLIWKRTIASQMSDARLERTTAEIENDSGLKFVARGEMISFDGFLKVYKEKINEDNSGLLPNLEKGEIIDLISATATQRFTRPPGRFSEATLVKSMEELGIGRPSTYAPTITTIQKRGYVQKGDSEGIERTFSKGSFSDQKWNWEQIKEKAGSNKGKMVPTDLGNLVTDFLNQHFAPVMDYQFTAKMESDFDLISTGSAPWTEVLSDFYSDFSPLVGKAGDAERESGQRTLGIDPDSGKNIYVRLAKFGPVIQVGEISDEEKPKFVGLPKEFGLETVTLEEALPLLALPRMVGTYNGESIIANNGRFGAYVQVKKKFVSLPPEITPFNVSESQAIELIVAKAAADAAAQLAVFEGPDGIIEVRKGRFGPYIKFNKGNFKIPKDIDAESLTLEASLKIIEEAPAKKLKRSTKKSSKKS
tara:strand:+ start:8741 stop:11038 length:2298 start_codon:yes stop_codon:yes gene_type:complete